jgi:hypothetical protein
MSKRPTDKINKEQVSAPLEPKKYFVVKNRQISTPVNSNTEARDGNSLRNNKTHFGLSLRRDQNKPKIFRKLAYKPLVFDRFNPQSATKNKFVYNKVPNTFRSTSDNKVLGLTCLRKPDKRHIIRNNENYKAVFSSKKIINKKTKLYEGPRFLDTRKRCNGVISKQHQYLEKKETPINCIKMHKLLLLFLAKKQATKSNFLKKRVNIKKRTKLVTMLVYNLHKGAGSFKKVNKTVKKTNTRLFYKKNVQGAAVREPSLGYYNYAKTRLKQKLKEISNFIKKPLSALQKLPKITKKNKQVKTNNSFWLNYYSFNTLQPLFGRQLTIINFNILNAANLNNYKKITRNALSAFPFLQLNRVAAHFIATVYTAMVLKESKAITLFIRKIMRGVHFKKHPFYFSFVGSLIKDVIKPQLHTFNCLGLSVVFRGKLGIGGNARKRALKYQTGMISSSSKYVKLSRSINVVRTKTGIVGFSVILA